MAYVTRRHGALAWIGSLTLSCSTAGTQIGTADSGGEPASIGSIDAAPDAGVDAAAAADGSTEAANGDSGGADATGTDASGATLVDLRVSTGLLVPPFDPGVTDYSMTSLNAVYPIQVTATASDPAAPIFIHGSPARSGEPSSFRLAAGEDFGVSLGTRTYVVHYMPADVPTYSVSKSAGAGTEDVLISTNLKYAAIMNRDGALLYYRSFQPWLTEDFQRFTLPDGQIEYVTEVGSFDPGGWLLGAGHVMDAQFRDLADFQLVPSGSHDVLPADAHDFILVDHDHYVAMSYVQRTQDLSQLNPAWSSQATVINAVVQEVVAGTPVFEWDSANVPSLYSDSLLNNTFQAGQREDYLHMNSMCIDPADGNFVFSFRHTDSIVKVDRKTGQILWTLGGKEDQFGLTGDQVFSFQHYVRVEPDGSLWVFDNGNMLHQTRVISFVLDQANKKVLQFTDVYDKPAGQPQTDFMGSYAQLGASRYLFGWGGWVMGAPGLSATEVSGGSVVWSLTFADPAVFSYRALPIGAL
ncbi:MAG TPA: aryl-sulfate sulfotransferase [Polyangiaceae bacterium]